jgi:DNA polymerase III delta prime subunit
MRKIDNLVWCEKYRPSNIDDCILPKETKAVFSQIIKSGKLPNMMFAGPPGSGKGSSVNAICCQLQLDKLFVNCSENTGIDTLRNKIRQFASSYSLSGGYKVVILDEFDYATANFQTALRGFIEEFSSNCRFIITCNYKNRIIEPIHSRCSVIEFSANKKVLAELSSQFMKRLKFILDAENVKYLDKTIAEIIIKHAPDWRRIVNECQRYSNSGELSLEALVSVKDDSLKSLIGYLKTKEFKKMRSWVSANADYDANTIFKRIYDSLSTFADPKTVPEAVLILAEWEYKSAFMADPEICMTACLTELMRDVEWK